MASTLVLTLELEKSQTQLRLDTKLGADKPREGLQALRNQLKRVASGIERSKVSVQTGGAAPVAASGTWTLASVVDTDAVSLGGVTLTFASSPSLETDIEVDVGSAKAFASSTDIALATGIITETAHGYLTTDVVQVSTSNALPAGIAASTDYYIIKLTDDTYQLATTLANASAGVPLRPTTTGTGNQTVTVQADKTMAVRLAACVNAHSTLSTLVSASASGAIVTVTAHQKGVVGNFIAFSDADSTITSSGSGYLADGAGGATEAVQTYVLGL